MYAIRGSTAASENEALVERERTGTGPTANVEWVAGCLADLRATGEDETLVLLLGGRSAYDFRVRVAQSHLRGDMSPSHWSHTALVDAVGEPVGATVLREVSLEPRGSVGCPATTNTVIHAARLVRRPRAGAQHRGPQRAGAALRVAGAQRGRGPARADLGPRAAHPAAGRRRPAGAAAAVAGLRVGRGALGRPAPRRRRAAVGGDDRDAGQRGRLDLTPGLDSRAATPEGFWQTARWWHTYFELQDRPPVHSFCWVPDRLDYAAPRSRRVRLRTTAETAPGQGVVWSGRVEPGPAGYGGRSAGGGPR